MPRRPRLQGGDLPMHIIQRGNNRQACCLTEEKYRCFSPPTDVQYWRWETTNLRSRRRNHHPILARPKTCLESVEWLRAHNRQLNNPGEEGWFPIEGFALKGVSP